MSVQCRSGAVVAAAGAVGVNAAAAELLSGLSCPSGGVQWRGAVSQ